MDSTSPDRLVIIDGHAILFRAYFALPTMTSPSGQLTNAVYGFTRILLNVIDELEPSCIALTFDSPGPTFREQKFAAYKAQRPETPADLISQFDLTKQVVRAFNVPQFEVPGWEADDLIGTLANQAVTEKEMEVIIVTGDKDLFQLVDDKRQIKVFIPGMKGKDSVMYDEAQVVVKMEITNKQVPDYKGLSGDTSDNIPGIKGIGPKTAVKLLQKFGSLEGIYEALPKGEVAEVLGKSMLAKLTDNQELAFQCRELATIMVNAPVSLELDTCRINNYNKADVLEVFTNFGFKSLISRMPDDSFELDVQQSLF